jgi:hypothetical protein
LSALGLKHEDIKTFALDHGTEAVVKRIQTDDQFVRQFHPEALRETLTLSYPSYILALAMGAGKTALIGAIVATRGHHGVRSILLASVYFLDCAYGDRRFRFGV